MTAFLQHDVCNNRKRRIIRGKSEFESDVVNFFLVFHRNTRISGCEVAGINNCFPWVVRSKDYCVIE
ncbi:unnamed protein product [Litomosoides sigmodontis]|uniref:Uncharacterized protein n=1 Tax=Litomosoides sigmodontis TaxID=42156 RepID=A0A3P6U6K5_LITSI|nr:unnamed protein product [Litomosoides sigmodontis]